MFLTNSYRSAVENGWRVEIIVRVDDFVDITEKSEKLMWVILASQSPIQNSIKRLRCSFLRK